MRKRRVVEFFSPKRIATAAFGDGLPPGPGRWPYLGVNETIQAIENPLGFMVRNAREFGPVFTTRVLGLKIVWVVGPEANQHILVDNASNFSWKQGNMGDLIPFIGQGVLTTDDEVHDRARRLLLPAFQKKQIATYADEMVRRANGAADRLHAGQELEIYDWTRQLAVDIAMAILLGMDPGDELCQKIAHSFEHGLAFYGMPLHLQMIRGPLSPFDRMVRHRRQIDRVLDREIKRRRRAGSDGSNLIDMLLNARDGKDRFSDKEVHDQVMNLLFAGHDTTTATVSWMTSLLGQHRDEYARLQDEIDTVLEGRAPTAEDLMSGLPYLNQVLAETLRLYPPAWIGPRKAINDFEVYGQRIPGGTELLYSSFLTHRLPELFPDPDAFDPERFTPERKKALPPGAYVPFGRGARLCIGMQFGELEVKAIMVSLLQRFHLELVPGQLFVARTVPTISPRNGVRVILRRRDAYRAYADKPVAKPVPEVATTEGCPVVH